MRSARLRSPRKWSFGRAVALCIGVLGSLVAFAPLTSLIQGPESFALRWLAFWCLGWICILVHELGHALAGRCMGMTIVRFYVIPLEIRMKPLSFHFARRVFGQDLGGAVVFRHAPYASRGERVILSLAGPIANFASAAMLAGLAFAGPAVAPEIVACLIAISLTLGLANLIPFDTSDGAMILNALRRSSRAKMVPSE